MADTEDKFTNIFPMQCIIFLAVVDMQKDWMLRCCILGVNELNPIDEPRSFHSSEKELPFQPAKCFLSVKWLAAMGELY